MTLFWCGTRSRASSQLETAGGFRFHLLDRDRVHPSVRRSVPHPFHHASDGTFVTDEMRLDRAVRAIANPAADSKLARLTLGPGAEEDALHTAGYEDGARHDRHRDRLMSGASSAFMPTTL